MGMNYVPVYENEAGDEEGIVRVSPQRVQMLGVRSEVVEARDLVRPIRAAGTIAFDERRSFVVTTKAEGWIEQLLVNATGETVRRGQPLMRVYSPDLLLAQQEYAALREAAADGAASGRCLGAAARRRAAAAAGAGRAGGRGAVAAARWRIAAAYGHPALALRRHRRRQAGGGGDALHAGRAALPDRRSRIRLADRRCLRAGLANIAIGEQARVSLKAYPDRRFTGRVAFVYPSLGGETRTARVRIELANPGGLLKENMYATVEIAAPVGRRGAGGAELGGDRQRRPAGGADRPRRRPL